MKSFFIATSVFISQKQVLFVSIISWWKIRLHVFFFGWNFGKVEKTRRRRKSIEKHPRVRWNFFPSTSSFPTRPFLHKSSILLRNFSCSCVWSDCVKYAKTNRSIKIRVINIFPFMEMNSRRGKKKTQRICCDGV